MNSNIKSYFLFVFLAFHVFVLTATDWTREEYIEMYSKWAVGEMNRSGIPASITLAQGMLESNNGNSTLATKGNNHFGIKCHDWKGKKIIHDDDEKNECFRKYKSAQESFMDHSDFLMGSPRYSFLFELEQTDYKGWAKGLKKAGYATAPKYADMLIKIIEDNDLHMYDTGKRRPVAADAGEGQELADVDDFEIEMGRHVLVRNRINYIIVKEGDTYQSINEEYEMLPFELAKYNEIMRDSKLVTGQVLYLQPKRNKASVEYRFHTVEEGETMYAISQMYGIRLQKLMQLNLMKEGEEPAADDIIHLRKKKEEVVVETETETRTESEIED